MKQTPAKQPAKKPTKIPTSGERLNFIIAVCAILISAASFYATYLQADAANKQVKAMTLPMLQYRHGNVTDGEKAINFSLKNAGIGPALIKRVEFNYADSTYQNIFQILNVCCKPAVNQFQNVSASPDSDVHQFVTNPVNRAIIAGQDDFIFLRLRHHVENDSIWQKLNQVRFEIGFKACYCSMLDECFQTNERSEIQAVKSCQ